MSYEEELKILADYLQCISNLHGLQICITDNMTNFICLNKNVRNALQPFLLHKNSYCMHIKATKALWGKCIYLKDCIGKKFRMCDSMIYGMCHAGIEEYVVPVRHNGNLVALIHAGAFCSNEIKARRKINKISRLFGYDENILLDYYYASVKCSNPDPENISILLGMAAKSLSNIYSCLEPVMDAIKENKKEISSENYILMHVIEFIRQNYRNDINIDRIADFCHCSRYYLSHIFNKNMNQNISTFINNLRMEEAKLYLQNTNLPIKTISSHVGFNDPNYFSKVFTGICGISPKEFRRSI